MSLLIFTLAIKADGGHKLATLTLDLNYFKALGNDIEVIRMSFAEFTASNDMPIVLDGSKALSTTNKAKFMLVSLPKAEVSEGLTVELTNDAQAVGLIGDVLVSLNKGENNVLVTTLEGTIDPNTEWSVYLQFENDTIYEIRFKQGWVGVYNLATSNFEQWNGKVQNPVYGEGIVTQLTDLSFFSDLGRDLSSVRVCPAQGANVYKYIALRAAQFANQDTWMTLVF